MYEGQNLYVRFHDGSSNANEARKAAIAVLFKLDLKNVGKTMPVHKLLSDYWTGIRTAQNNNNQVTQVSQVSPFDSRYLS